MIILLEGNQVIDVVKSYEVLEGGIIKVIRYDNSPVIYRDEFQKIGIEVVPENLDFNNLSKYTYENGIFINKKQEKYTKEDFYKIFTKEQLLEIWGSQDPEVKYFVLMLPAFSVIDVTNTETILALRYLNSVGLMTSEQLNNVLL